MYRTHDVRIFAQKAKEPLEAPEEASQATQNASSKFVIPFLDFLIDVFENDADYTANSDDKGAECDCS